MLHLLKKVFFIIFTAKTSQRYRNKYDFKQHYFFMFLQKTNFSFSITVRKLCFLMHFFRNHKHLRDDIIALIIRIIKHDLSTFLLNLFGITFRNT